MSRKMRLIGIGILSIVVIIGLFLMFEENEHKEHSWEAGYRVDIVADPGEHYSLINRSDTCSRPPFYPY